MNREMRVMNWVQNLAVSMKMALAPGFAILGLLLVGLIGYVANERLSGSLIDLGEQRVPRIVINSDISEQITTINASVNQSLAWEGAGFKAATIEALDKHIAGELLRYKGILQAALQKPDLEDDERKQLTLVAAEFDKYADSATQALDIKTGMLSNAASFMTTMESRYATLKAVLDGMIREQTAKSSEAVASAKAQAASNRVLILSGFSAALVASVFISWVMSKMIVSPIRQMQIMMTEIATSQDFSRRVPVERMDEIGMSIVAFNTMIAKIQESSQQLKQKTADIQAMMHYIPQGILTVMEGEEVHPEFSVYLEKILETKDIAGRSLMDLIFADCNFSAEALSQVEAAVSACIGEDSMNFEFNSHLLVSEVEKKMPDGRVKTLDLSWSPITDDTDTVVRLMLCVRDVTELKVLAAEAGQQKRELDIIGQILAVGQEKFAGFIDGAVEFLAENKKIIGDVGATPKGRLNPETVTQLFRNMHTIKGNARTYGLLHLTHLVHEAEQSYAELRKNPDAIWDQKKLLTELAHASAAIEEYAHINRVKLGRTGPGRRGSVEKYLMVQKQDIQDAIEMMEESVRRNDVASMGATYPQVHRMLQMLGTVPIREVLEGILDSLPSLAKELSKVPPQISIVDHNIVLRSQVADLLKNVFMHLYRNSLDHGIESSSERIAKGKAPAGHIRLELALVDGRFVLTLRDDGRGLALDRIKKKALQNGLIPADRELSAQEIAKLIFLPGFSTAEQVTEVSGRGVGMDAVQGFVAREEGSIELRLLDTTAADGCCPFETVISLPAAVAVQAPAL
jgi:two-component system, chemotaxis family, sensor kinase CheA